MTPSISTQARSLAASAALTFIHFFSSHSTHTPSPLHHHHTLRSHPPSTNRFTSRLKSLFSHSRHKRTPNSSSNASSSLPHQAAQIAHTPSPSPPPFSVFISHAGEDKLSIALPLRQKLARLNIPAFVDKMDMTPGSHAPSLMHAAMSSAPVAVFILSDDFVAKKWPMLELLTFLHRVQSPSQSPHPPPKLIPFFYRLTLDDCTQPSLFWRINPDPKHGFAHRTVNGDLSLQQASQSLQNLSKWVGVENPNSVTNEDTPAMHHARDILIDQLVLAIQAALDH